MCHIAGYSGKNQAAPRLLEMLRRQQYYDGGVCTGITTVYNGRLYCRKVVGDVDTLISTTDALYLPGNVGIAHSRPGGSPKTYSLAHPFLTEDETMAGMTNGTTRAPGYDERVRRALAFLEDQGCVFKGAMPPFDDPDTQDNSARVTVPSSVPVLRDGRWLSCVEARTALVHHYVKQGATITAAMARTASECFTDSVLGILSTLTPDSFYVLRTSRPAFYLSRDGETFVTTAPFGLPDGEGERGSLPVMSACRISADGVTVSGDRMSGCEEVGIPRANAVDECYRRICALLSGKKDSPLVFDDLESEVWNNMRDLFEGDQTIIQDAWLVYMVLDRLMKENRLKTKLGQYPSGRKVTKLWLED